MTKKSKARLARDKSVWTLQIPPESETVYTPPPDPDANSVLPLTEENVITACSISLALMLMLRNPHSDSGDNWWGYCQTESLRYPQGSFRSVFWWSLRTMGFHDSEENNPPSVEDFFNYFQWKWSQFEPTGHIKRDAIW